MSLDIALHNALSGLRTVQSALQVNSNNIANANTEGYSRKSVEQVSLVLAGNGAGVSVAGITREVSDSLLRELRGQSSTMGKLSINSEFFQRMQDLFGSLSGNGVLTSGLSNLAARLEAMAASPEDAAHRQAVVTAAVALTQGLNTAARDIQKLRTDADQGVAAAVDIVNARLGEIAELNSQISRNYAAGQPTVELLDQRDAALSALAEQMDFSTFTRDSGEVVIVTSGGRTLLDGAAPTLTHSPVAAADPGVVYPGGIDGINLNGVDITGEIRSGRIAGLVGMRDSQLPDLQSQMDALATTLREEINAIHNDGASFPAGNALTGTRAVTAADPITGAGTVRIAVVDAAGQLAAVPLDLDLTTVADVQDVIDAINAALGPDATAAIVGGRLQIAAANGAHGIAINEGTSAVGTRGFSHHFGLNDLFVSAGGPSLSRTIGVRSDIVANPHLLSRGELNMTAALAGDVAITAGGNAVAAQLAARFDTSATFAAAGGLPTSNTTFADYGAQILALNATRAADATNTLTYQAKLYEDLSYRADSISGVNLDEEMANLIVLQRNYGAVARLINVSSELMDVLIRLGN